MEDGVGDVRNAGISPLALLGRDDGYWGGEPQRAWMAVSWVAVSCGHRELGGGDALDEVVLFALGLGSNGHGVEDVG